MNEKVVILTAEEIASILMALKRMKYEIELECDSFLSDFKETADEVISKMLV